MYKTTVNSKSKFEIELVKGLSEGTIDGDAFSLDITKLSDGSIHVLYNSNSYTIRVVEINRLTKELTLLVNNNPYTVELKDELDLMLEKLGMDASAGNAVKELKAPMPGLVIDVKVSSGDTLEKGDALMVLEAMKMENVLKAPAGVVVDKILVESGKTIEKNETLITFK